MDAARPPTKWQNERSRVRYSAGPSSSRARRAKHGRQLGVGRERVRGCRDPEPPVDLSREQVEALVLAIDAWFEEVEREGLPPKVEDLREALHDEPS